MPSTSKTQGEMFAKAGAATAAAHAGDDWVASAMSHANDFLSYYAPNVGKFQTAHLRKYAETRGLPEAPDARAWGHITRKLKKQNRIVAAGVGRSFDPRQHYGFCTEWRAV